MMNPKKVGFFVFYLVIASIVSTLGLALGTPAQAEDTRATNPNTVGVEILGRGMRYSVFFDRAFGGDFSAGVGLGSAALNYPNGGGDAGVSVGLVPFYANYYFVRDQSSLFLTAGAILETNNSTALGLNSSMGGVYFNSNSVLPTFGLGYENRGDYGFLFRVAGYGIVSDKVYPWGGMSLGFCF